MEFARSADGTMIAYERSGTGPPLVLVHGALGDHNAWFALVPLLAPHFTLYTIDRRGRGASGDTPPYAVEREVEDIIAVVDTIGEPAALFGHSSGAVLSLAVTRRTPSVQKLIAYEPPIPVDAQSARAPEDVQEQMRALLVAGNRDDVIRLAMHLTMQAPEVEINAMQANPMWSYLTALAHTAPYDMAIWAQPYVPEDLAAVHIPTLFLIGEVTLPWLKSASETIAALLPNSRIAIMPGQDHMATIGAPQLVASEALNFLTRQTHRPSAPHGHGAVTIPRTCPSSCSATNSNDSVLCSARLSTTAPRSPRPAWPQSAPPPAHQGRLARGVRPGERATRGRRPPRAAAVPASRSRWSPPARRTPIASARA